MAKFRKKPVVIEAWQFTGQGRWEWPEWLKGHSTAALQSGHPAAASQSDWPEYQSLIHEKYATPWISIDTLEGRMRADVGDWVIQGVKGEVYPCKPDIFAATYEEVAP
jgi:hypothetical protein